MNEPTQQEPLLQCPFCNGSNILITNPHSGEPVHYVAICTPDEGKPGCGASGTWCDTVEEATAKWNTRTPTNTPADAPKDATGDAGEELAKVTAAAVNLEPDENGPGLFEYDDPQGRYVTAEFAREQARTIATLRAECESKRLEILERIGREAADRVFMDEYQDQRDTAQQALSHAYYLITGKSPQWSDTFGAEQAVQEIDDAQRLLRDECAGLREDKVRLDWLEKHTVNVRVPLVHGSRDLFWSSPDDDDGVEEPSDIRARIDAASRAETEGK